jgi:hypothetical protein
VDLIYIAKADSEEVQPGGSAGLQACGKRAQHLAFLGPGAKARFV